MGFAVFKQRPTSLQVCSFLDRAIRRTGSAPKHIITDKGREFACWQFRRWCRGRGIRPRFGAVGEHGSIAVIERVMRSMKAECARRIIVPLRLEAMRREVACYATWYNEHRPHTALGGRTPLEVWLGARPANEKPRFEPRADWPRGGRCARPAVAVKGSSGARLTLVLGRVENRRHLPVVKLKRVA